jgi:hypothetical protein
MRRHQQDGTVDGRELDKLKVAVGKAQAMNLPVRFWNTNPTTATPGTGDTRVCNVTQLSGTAFGRPVPEWAQTTYDSGGLGRRHGRR